MVVRVIQRFTDAYFISSERATMATVPDYPQDIYRHSLLS
jgi:hypothetical protein